MIVPEVMTVKTAADVLSVSIETVRRMLRDGRLKGAKIGGNYRITRADVDALLRASGSAGLEPLPPIIMGKRDSDAGEGDDKPIGLPLF